MIFLILLKFALFGRKNQRHLKLHCFVTAAAAVNAFWPKKKRKNFSFKCPNCGFVNQLDFTQMCNEYTVKLLQDKTLQVERVKIEQALIKLKLQEYDWFF